MVVFRNEEVLSRSDAQLWVIDASSGSSPASFASWRDVVNHLTFGSLGLEIEVLKVARSVRHKVVSDFGDDGPQMFVKGKTTCPICGGSFSNIGNHDEKKKHQDNLAKEQRAKGNLTCTIGAKGEAINIRFAQA